MARVPPAALTPRLKISQPRQPGPARTIPRMKKLLEEMVQRVRRASQDGSPLRLVGGGSKDGFGQSLHGEPLDTRGYTGIVSYEPSELVVTVRCGTPLAELEAALAEHGQCLAFEPPHFGAGATVGGMVAAGLAGPARANAGAVRDFILGTTLINGRGELLTFGGQVMKNVAGYDVSRLMAGSWGTLALIAEVSLKVLPVAPAESTLVFDDLDEAQALDRLHRWAGQPLPLNASSWWDGRLTLRLRGARAAVASATQSLGGRVLAPGDAAAHWLALREQTAAFFALAGDECLWRLSVPDTTPPLTAFGPTLIEWHGAQRWVKRARDDSAARAAAVQAGGHATLWRTADGTHHANALTRPAEALMRIHRNLKQQFDPGGVFGRGRMYPDL